jgi:hypothetical protein
LTPTQKSAPQGPSPQTASPRARFAPLVRTLPPPPPPPASPAPPGSPPRPPAAHRPQTALVPSPLYQSDDDFRSLRTRLLELLACRSLRAVCRRLLRLHLWRNVVHNLRSWHIYKRHWRRCIQPLLRFYTCSGTSPPTAVCPVGSTSSTGLLPCTACPQGFYFLNASACAQCPAGMTTLSTGSPSVSSCQRAHPPSAHG